MKEKLGRCTKASCVHPEDTFSIRTHLRQRRQTLDVHKHGRDSRRLSNPLWRRRQQRHAQTLSASPRNQPVRSGRPTCQRLKVAFAKYPLLLWCLGGEDDGVHHRPVVQGVHKSHSLRQHQLRCREKPMTSLTKIPQHAPRVSVGLIVRFPFLYFTLISHCNTSPCKTRTSLYYD